MIFVHKSGMIDMILQYIVIKKQSCYRSGFMNKNILTNTAKGTVIGASMLIPGVSGGTTAIILGIYDKLISSVSSFFKNPKKNLVFLGSIAVGGIIGLLLFAKAILFLINAWEIPMLYLFIGAVLGSVPLLFQQAGLKRLTPGAIIFPLIGIGIVALMALLPKDLFNVDAASPMLYVMLFIGGIFISIALILPGISTSYMLLILGIYQPTLNAIETMNFPFIACLGIGILAGIILCTKVLETAMNKFPQPTYLIIIGFVLGSLKDVFPGVPTGIDIPMSILTLLVGCSVVYYITKRFDFTDNPAE